jgi:catechol 2,3-dioxygenase-like lactoylglutathione lyase family enzyme
MPGTIGSMFTPLGLDHVVLRVADQARSQRFYVDVLGCSVDHVNDEARLVQLRFGEQLIDLLPATEPRRGGMDHFCLSIRCDDLEKVATALRARGVEVVGAVVPRRGAWGTGPSLYLRDPDGYTVELKPR